MRARIVKIFYFVNGKFCKTSFTFELSRKSSNLEMNIHFVNGKFCKTSFTFELSQLLNIVKLLNFICKFMFTNSLAVNPRI